MTPEQAYWHACSNRPAREPTAFASLHGLSLLRALTKFLLSTRGAHVRVTRLRLSITQFYSLAEFGALEGVAISLLEVRRGVFVSDRNTLLGVPIEVVERTSWNPRHPPLGVRVLG